MSAASVNQSRYGVTERTVPVSTDVPADNLRWSATSVTTFEQCPLKLWWGKVAGWQEGPSLATAAGTAVHSALEELFGREPGERTPEVTDTALVTAVDSARDELVAARVPVDDVLAKGVSALEVYWHMEDPNSIEIEPGGLERKVGPVLGDIPFTGYADRVAVSPTGSRVSDYKTGIAKPRYFGPYYRQQYLYAAALADEGFVVTEIELLFLGDGRRVRRPVYDAAIERAVGTLAEVAADAAHMAARAEWIARQSPLCGWCSFEPVCPLRRTRVPQPGSPESDERLAEIPGMVQRVAQPRGTDGGSELVGDDETPISGDDVPIDPSSGLF